MIPRVRSVNGAWFRCHGIDHLAREGTVTAYSKSDRFVESARDVRVAGAFIRKELEVEARVRAVALDLAVALKVAGSASDPARAIEDERRADTRAKDRRGATIGWWRLGAESVQDEVIVGWRAHSDSQRIGVAPHNEATALELRCKLRRIR